jgi:hypothetical protein
LPENVLMLEAEFLPTSIKLIPVCFSFFGAGLALILNVFFQQLVSIFTTFKLYIYIYKNNLSENFKIKVLTGSVVNFNNIINFKCDTNNIIIKEVLLINIPSVYKFLNKK